MTNSYSNSSGNVISSPSELGLAGDKIAVHFKSIDQNVDQALACDLNEIFLNVENRLKNICDEIKNKNCRFLHAGAIIDKNKTLQENNIHDGEKILIDYN